MKNKTAFIVGSVLFFPGMYLFAYLLDVMTKDGTPWFLFPSIIVGSIYLTFTGIMTFAGFHCWLNEK